MPRRLVLHQSNKEAAGEGREEGKPPTKASEYDKTRSEQDSDQSSEHTVEPVPLMLYYI